MKIAEIVIDKNTRLFSPADNLSITCALRQIINSDWKSITIEYQDVELTYQYK